MGKHKNPAQEKLILEFMEAQPNVAKNLFKGDRVQLESLWGELSKKLNGVGPPKKDVNGWKKIWSDWKGTIRKKVSHNKYRTGRTGDDNQYVFSPTEDAIANICDIYTAFKYVPKSVSFGVPDELENTMNSILSSSDVDDMRGSIFFESRPPQKRIRSGEIQHCMKNNRSMETTAVKNISQTMKLVLESTKKSVKICEDHSSSVRGTFKSIEKLTDLVSQQNILSAEQNEIRRAHYMKMEKLVEDRLKVKRRRLDIKKERLAIETRK